MLTNVVRLLRQFNYDSLVFPSAEAFASHRGFDGAVCILLDIDLGDGSGIELRQRLKAANSHLHDRERKPDVRVSWPECREAPAPIAAETTGLPAAAVSGTNDADGRHCHVPSGIGEH
jgi:CheY-like chemotaxis protein